jgi:AraC family ethanolamine operon transcriptional activator
VFQDIDEQAASLQGWNQRYEQLSAGRFSGEIRHLALDGIRLFIEDLQQSIHQTGCVNSDVLAFGVPILFDGEVRFSGQQGNGHDLHVFSGSSGFEFHSPKRHIMLCIEVQRSLVNERYGEDDQAVVLANTQRSQLLRTERGALRRLRACALSVFQQSPTKSCHLSSCNVNGVRDELLGMLVETLSSPEEPVPVSHAGAIHLERRARQLVMSRLDDPPSVAELCSSLGVSRRTLQSCFQTTWDMGPLSWLNTMRLNAVRRRLKGAKSVTDVATELGFWHFGHFSRDYKALFGELPSETLAKNHKWPITSPQRTYARLQ